MRNRYHQVLAAMAMLLCVVSIASAQYEQGFENLVGSPQGYPLTNQDGYYLPTGSTDFNVYTYAGNALEYPVNPTGGQQFIAGVALANGVYARAQRDIDFIWDPGVWKFQYDFAVKYTLTGVSVDNIASFSVRSDNVNNINDYIHLMTWVDPNNPTNFNAFYMAYDAGGVQFAAPGQSPGPGWEGLQVNHWYNAWTTIDLMSNMVTEVGITDLATGITNVATPSGWYLDGGAAGGGGLLPIAFRMFAGGTNGGNSSAWDNLSIEPVGAPVTGACCVGTECSVVTQADCDNMGGQYMGDNTTCDPNPCATPVKATTWGGIKSSYR